MLKPAQLYQSELNHKIMDGWYDPKNLFFEIGPAYSIINLDSHTLDDHDFVSIDESGEVIGYVGYSVAWIPRSAYQLAIISFDKGNLLFLKDVYQAIYDCFYKHNMNRLEWTCYADNPAIRGYRKFIELCGGVECGYRRQCMMLPDGKLHDQVRFEILKEEFKPLHIK